MHQNFSKNVLAISSLLEILSERMRHVNKQKQAVFLWGK